MTHRIDRIEIEGLPVLAEGYKIFDDTWSCQGYCYADDKGDVEGSVHKIEGKLEMCNNGLHFCENAVDCFKYYAPVQWNKFAKVRAYGEKETQGEKTACTILEIVKVLSWDEMIEECTEHTTDIRGGYGINGGAYIYGGNAIYGGSNIWGGDHIYGGGCISGGSNINGASDINGGSDISGAIDIWGGCDIGFSEKLKGAYACILCYNINGVKYRIFNKKVTKARFEVVNDELRSFGWVPVFTNAWDLKNNKGWEETPAPKIAAKTPKEAYREMPKNLLEYIRNMPEYDKEIFNKITHGAVEEE